MHRKKYESVEQYFNDHDGATLDRIGQIREIIFKLSPECDEKISYNIPAYFLNDKMFLYFAGYENHVSLYPLHLIENSSKKQFAKYASGKATFKIPNSENLPVELIKKFITLRIDQTRNELASANSSF